MDKQFSAPFATVAAPVASRTWSVEAELSRTVPDSGVISLPFTRAIEVVGMHAVVVPKRPLAGGGLVTPTLADIDVMWSTDNEDRWTAEFNEEGTSPGFVALSSLDLERRILLVEPRGDAPSLEFTFAWRNFLQGTPFFEDALISLNLFIRFVDRKGPR